MHGLQHTSQIHTDSNTYIGRRTNPSLYTHYTRIYFVIFCFYFFSSPFLFSFYKKWQFFADFAKLRDSFVNFENQGVLVNIYKVIGVFPCFYNDTRWVHEVVDIHFIAIADING